MLVLFVFAFINAGFESGIMAISAMPFVVGCCLLRLAFFRDRERANA